MNKETENNIANRRKPEDRRKKSSRRYKNDKRAIVRRKEDVEDLRGYYFVLGIITSMLTVFGIAAFVYG
ncbi:MAG: hypothetical protein GY793_04350 [Proteobacteria bacterium]|nr:hypothetical protein [Pseudomonadota bacterium]